MSMALVYLRGKLIVFVSHESPVEEMLRGIALEIWLPYPTGFRRWDKVAESGGLCYTPESDRNQRSNCCCFSKTEYQRCIVHQVRNTLKYIPDKDRKSFATDLKTICQAAELPALDMQICTCYI